MPKKSFKKPTSLSDIKPAPKKNIQNKNSKFKSKNKSRSKFAVIFLTLNKNQKDDVKTNSKPSTIQKDFIDEPSLIENMIEASDEKIKQLPPTEAEEIIKTKSKEVINALKNKNLTQITDLMHSEKKLIFSSYAHFSEKNKSFTQAEVKNLFNDSTKYIWGTYNGISTGPIEMTFKNYYETFIYDKDFSQASKISYNQNTGQGIIKNNAQEFFPNSIVVEYHFSGFSEELDGMDWRSLRLIFINIENEWYLQAISHDELTI